MKSILISIKPKYVAKILNGEKTIEIRKTMPKCDLPIDVYIYCTKTNHLVYFGYGFGNVECLDTKKQKDLMAEWKLGNWNDIKWCLDKKVNARVVAKFTLNNVEEICIKYGKGWVMGEKNVDTIEKETCLTIFQLFDYIGRKGGYAWHISNLVIFDKPKELSEFSVRYPKGDIKFKGVKGKMLAMKQLTKAPQSWQFIEVDE